MLQRMHGKARPRAHIDVAMMQRVGSFVEEWHMKEPVHPIEVKGFPNRNEEEKSDEPNGIRGPGNHGGIAIG